MPLPETIRAMARAVERRTGADGEHVSAIPSLRLYRQSKPSEPVACLYEASLCLVLQGSKRALLGREVYRYDPANYLVVCADLALLGEVTHATAREPYLGLRIAIDPALAGELLATVPPRPEAPPARALAVSALDAPLLDAVARLLALLDDAAHIPVLAPLVVREIVYRLLAGDEGGRLRQIVAAGGQGRGITNALRWLRGNYAEPLRVEELARKVGMSASTFHHHFKTVTGMSPLHYQKQLRLHEARRLLLSEKLDAGEASYRVGYESPSQFSREYRRLFGAPPRRDVAALLGPPPPMPG